MGAPHPEQAPGARSLVEGSYLIRHSVETRAVRIARVLHGARDITPDLLR